MQRIVSRLRTTSIKRRLWSLMLLLSLMVAMLGGFIVYSSLNAAAGQLRQSGQQLLYSAVTQMEEDRQRSGQPDSIPCHCQHL